MGANDKLAATFHPATTGAEYPCGDCGTVWDTKLAADECELLDSIDARAARRNRG